MIAFTSISSSFQKHLDCYPKNITKFSSAQKITWNIFNWRKCIKMDLPRQLLSRICLDRRNPITLQHTGEVVSRLPFFVILIHLWHGSCPPGRFSELQSVFWQEPEQFGSRIYTLGYSVVLPSPDWRVLSWKDGVSGCLFKRTVLSPEAVLTFL